MARRSTFRQADIERLIKAAAKTNSLLHIDLRTLIATVLPNHLTTEPERRFSDGYAPDGKENWDV